MAKPTRRGSIGSAGSGGQQMAAPTAFRQETAEQKAYYDAQFDALNRQLNARYGLTLDPSLRDREDFKGIRDSIYGVESVLREFPEAVKYLPGMRLGADDADPNTYAYANSANNSVTLGSALYMNYKTVGALMQSDVEAGFHPKGSTSMSVSQHETGHLISYAAARKLGYDILDVNRRNAAMREIVERAYSRAPIQGWLQRQGHNTVYKAKNTISGYAQYAQYRGGIVNWNETVAEAVSDYMSNRSRANPFSRQIVRELKSILRS